MIKTIKKLLNNESLVLGVLVGVAVVFVIGLMISIIAA